MVCDPVCDTGCPPGQRCDVTSTINTGQCLAPGTAAPGQACTATTTSDGCAPHSACVGNLCYRLCYVNRDCGTNQCCNIVLTDDNNNALGFNACASSSGCDPTATGPGPCGSGNACYFAPCATATALTLCGCASQATCGFVGAGSKGNGQSCNYANECLPGYTCYGSPASCRRTCLLAGGTACPALNPTCTAVQIDSGPPPVTSTTYGVCL